MKDNTGCWLDESLQRQQQQQYARKSRGTRPGTSGSRRQRSIDSEDQQQVINTHIISNKQYFFNIFTIFFFYLHSDLIIYVVIHFQITPPSPRSRVSGSRSRSTPATDTDSHSAAEDDGTPRRPTTDQQHQRGTHDEGVSRPSGRDAGVCN